MITRRRLLKSLAGLPLLGGLLGAEALARERKPSPLDGKGGLIKLQTRFGPDRAEDASPVDSTLRKELLERTERAVGNILPVEDMNTKAGGFVGWHVTMYWEELGKRGIRWCIPVYSSDSNLNNVSEYMKFVFWPRDDKGRLREFICTGAEWWPMYHQSK